MAGGAASAFALISLAAGQVNDFRTVSFECAKWEEAIATVASRLAGHWRYVGPETWKTTGTFTVGTQQMETSAACTATANVDAEIFIVSQSTVPPKAKGIAIYSRSLPQIKVSNPEAAGGHLITCTPNDLEAKSIESSTQRWQYLVFMKPGDGEFCEIAIQAVSSKLPLSADFRLTENDMLIMEETDWRPERIYRRIP